MTLITRSELRLVLTTGLLTGFASLSSLPFGYYAPMAVLAVCAGSYGNSLELGRQRILGSVLGMGVLVLSLRGLAGIPMPLGLGMALGAMRLIGGAVGLRVGYKVGGMIVVMGWLAHDQQLDAWVPLRLFWTVIGILVSLLSLSLLWTSRSRADAQALLAGMFVGLAEDLEREALSPAHLSRGRLAEARDERRRALQELRALLPALASELGDQPLRHPAFRLVETQEEAASRLIGAVEDLATHPAPGDAEARELRRAESALLGALADRLRTWSGLLREAEAAMPQPPATPFLTPPAWLAIEEHFSHPALNGLPPRRLERLAARLTLCRQALHAIETAERDWAALRHGPSMAMAPRVSSRLPADRTLSAG
jgi:hypothetical protein